MYIIPGSIGKTGHSELESAKKNDQNIFFISINHDLRVNMQRDCFMTPMISQSESEECVK